MLQWSLKRLFSSFKLQEVVWNAVSTKFWIEMSRKNKLQRIWPLNSIISLSYFPAFLVFLFFSPLKNWMRLHHTHFIFNHIIALWFKCIFSFFWKDYTQRNLELDGMYSMVVLCVWNITSSIIMQHKYAENRNYLKCLFTKNWLILLLSTFFLVNQNPIVGDKSVSNKRIKMCRFCYVFMNFRVNKRYIIQLNELQSEVWVNIGETFFYVRKTCHSFIVFIQK